MAPFIYNDYASAASETHWVQWSSDSSITTSPITVNWNWRNTTCSGDTWAGYTPSGKIVYRYARPNATGTAAWIKCDDVVPKRSPLERLREIIRNRVAPRIIVRHAPLMVSADVREQRARETLRRVIGDEKYRNFLRTGFVSVRARSGRTYQIFPGHKFTVAYENGRAVESLCVVLGANFPPTDSLIMRYLMLRNNEREFLRLANKQHLGAPARQQSIEMRPLSEVFADLKREVA